MFNSSQVNKFLTIKHALIFKTIGFKVESCVLCVTEISLILVCLGHPVPLDHTFGHEKLFMKFFL